MPNILEQRRIYAYHNIYEVFFPDLLMIETLVL